MTDFIFLFIILCLIPVSRYPVRYGNGFALKEHLFYLAGMAWLCKAAFFGAVYPSSLAGQFLLAYAIFGLMSVMWAVNVEKAWEDVPKWISLFALFTLVASIPMKTVMLLSVIPIPLYLAYGFMQTALKKDPLDKDALLGHFFGFIGNTNHSAAFLAPYTFISLWLAVNVSPWFFLLAAANLAGVVMTKCWASMLGTAIGVCFAFPPYSLFGLPVLAVTGTGLCLLRKYRKDWYVRLVVSKGNQYYYDDYGIVQKEKTLTARLYYLIVAYRIWRKHPVFGIGLNGYMKEVYDNQADLKGKYADLITSKGEYNAFPRRTHNDLAESLVELGTIGFLIMAGFMASVIYGAASSGNYILLAGVVCLIVNGFFFYTQSSFSYVPWMVLAACASGSGVSHFSLPLVAVLLVALFCFKLGLSYVIKPHLSMAWLARANMLADEPKEQERCVNKALELTPTYGAALSAAVELKAPHDPFISMFYQERAVHHYDGTMRAWGVWGRYGEMLMKCGNWEGAKRVLKYADHLNPSFGTPRMVLNTMEAEERKIIAAREEKALKDKQFRNLATGGRAA